VRYAGHKYSCHRLTFRDHHGQLSAEDVSHVLWLGAATGTNINPLYLVQESNVVNQSRALCHMYFEEEVERWELGMTGLHSWSDADFKQDLSRRNGACAVVHRHRRCEVKLDLLRVAI
jgi:hypothetical protein